jgi:hypothetical protein
MRCKLAHTTTHLSILSSRITLNITASFLIASDSGFGEKFMIFCICMNTCVAFEANPVIAGVKGYKPVWLVNVMPCSMFSKCRENEE